MSRTQLAVDPTGVVVEVQRVEVTTTELIDGEVVPIRSTRPLKEGWRAADAAEVASHRAAQAAARARHPEPAATAPPVHQNGRLVVDVDGNVVAHRGPLKISMLAASEVGDDEIRNRRAAAAARIAPVKPSLDEEILAAIRDMNNNRSPKE